MIHIEDGVEVDSRWAMVSKAKKKVEFQQNCFFFPIRGPRFVVPAADGHSLIKSQDIWQTPLEPKLCLLNSSQLLVLVQAPPHRERKCQVEVP